MRRGFIRPQLDIYNITNSAAILGQNDAYGPAWQQPALAAAVNVVIAVASGADPAMSVSALLSALQTTVETGGLVKIMDMLKGKTRVVSETDKKVLDVAKANPSCAAPDADPIKYSKWKSNQDLSVARAAAVKAYLVKKGVDESLVSVQVGMN